LTTIVGSIVGMPTIITPSACHAKAALLRAGRSMSADDDHADDKPTMPTTVLWVGIDGLPTIPTIISYFSRRKQKRAKREIEGRG